MWSSRVVVDAAGKPPAKPVPVPVVTPSPTLPPQARTLEVPSLLNVADPALGVCTPDSSWR